MISSELFSINILLFITTITLIKIKMSAEVTDLSQINQEDPNLSLSFEDQTHSIVIRGLEEPQYILDYIKTLKQKVTVEDSIEKLLFPNINELIQLQQSENR